MRNFGARVLVRRKIMKKLLTLALGVVVLVVFTGLSAAQEKKAGKKPAGVTYGKEITTHAGKNFSVSVPKGWSSELIKDHIDIKSGQVTIHVYPASDKFTTLDAVFDDITQHFQKEGIPIGSKKRLTYAGGDALWSEQLGSERPYLGAVSRGGKFFFVNAQDKAKNSPGVLESFLRAVRTVRPSSFPADATTTKAAVSNIRERLPGKKQAAPKAGASPSTTQTSPSQESQRKTRGWLGVTVESVTPERAKNFGLKNNRGALVTEVDKTSPAERAGIMVNDVILEYNGRQINDHTQLLYMVKSNPVGKIVPIRVLRNRKKVFLTATIGERDAEEWEKAIEEFGNYFFYGQKIGTDLGKWEEKIKLGFAQEAIERALARAAQRGELTQAQAAGAKAFIGPAMVFKDGERMFLAQRVIVPGDKGKPPVVDTYKFAELKEGTTLDAAAQELVRNILADNRIVTRMRDLAAPQPAKRQ